MGKRRRRTIYPKLRFVGDPILKAVCKPVEDDEDVDSIVRDMMYILVNSETGVGLAAPQAGHEKRIIIVKANGEFSVFINPEIIQHSRKTDIQTEGCLSFPGVFVSIVRYVNIHVAFLGMKKVYKCFGWEARIIQHEIDHLDGKCRVEMKVNKEGIQRRSDGRRKDG